MDKIITEFRVIETDDGFRIEVKGDKQAIHKWMKHLGMCSPMHRGRHRMPFGPWGFHHAHHGSGPWCASDEGSSEGPGEAQEA